MKVDEQHTSGKQASIHYGMSGVYRQRGLPDPCETGHRQDNSRHRVLARGEQIDQRCQLRVPPGEPRDPGRKLVQGDRHRSRLDQPYRAEEILLEVALTSLRATGPAQVHPTGCITPRRYFPFPVLGHG